jgi:hypothetical protein
MRERGYSYAREIDTERWGREGGLATDCKMTVWGLATFWRMAGEV